MAEKFANNASSTLAAGINNVVTSCSVQSGDGARWPTVATWDDWCWSTITDGTNIEIVKITGRSSDTFTIVRGQQGTTAQSWSAGATIQMRITRQTLEDFRDSSPRLVMATSFSAANFLESSNEHYNGGEDMTVGWVGRLARVEDDPGVTKCLLSNGNVFFDGWNTKYDSLRPYVSADHGGTKSSTGSFEPNWSGGTGAMQYWGFVDWKSVIIVMKVSGGIIKIFVNGVLFREIDVSANGSYVPGSNGLRVGLERDDTQPFTNGGFAGLAYYENSHSDDDIRAWTRACMEASDCVSGGLLWDNRISIKQLRLRGGDSCPGTVSAIEGSGDLFLSGSLSIVEEIPRWL